MIPDDLFLLVLTWLFRICASDAKGWLRSSQTGLQGRAERQRALEHSGPRSGRRPK